MLYFIWPIKSFQGFESAWSGSVRFGIGMGVNLGYLYWYDEYPNIFIGMK